MEDVQEVAMIVVRQVAMHGVKEVVKLHVKLDVLHPLQDITMVATEIVSANVGAVVEVRVIATAKVVAKVPAIRVLDT